MEDFRPEAGLELVVLVGLQGSGKSSFFRHYFGVPHAGGRHAHVSKDLFPNNRDKARRQRVLIDDPRYKVINRTHPGAALVHAESVVCPILCFTGSHDRINPPATVKRIANRYRGRAVFEELEGFSHWLVGEPGWEKIAARTLGWIGEIDGAGTRKTRSRS